MRWILAASLIVGPIRLLAQGAGAVRPSDASGPYVTGGAGVAHASYSCSGCASSGVGLALRTVVGWRFGQRLGVGVGIDGETRSERPTREYQVHLTGVVEAHPGYHILLRAGVGSARVALQSATTGSTFTLKGHGLGWLVGIGFEKSVLPRLNASPFITYRRSGALTLFHDGVPVVRSYSFRTFEAGFALTWSVRTLMHLGFGERPPN